MIFGQEPLLPAERRPRRRGSRAGRNYMIHNVRRRARDGRGKRSMPDHASAPRGRRDDICDTGPSHCRGVDAQQGPPHWPGSHEGFPRYEGDMTAVDVADSCDVDPGYVHRSHVDTAEISGADSVRGNVWFSGSQSASGGAVSFILSISTGLPGAVRPAARPAAHRPCPAKIRPAGFEHAGRLLGSPWRSNTLLARHRAVHGLSTRGPPAGHDEGGTANPALQRAKVRSKPVVLPKRSNNWPLASLRQRLVKTSGRPIKHARYYWLMLAGSQPTRRLFGSMVRRIAALPVPAGNRRE